MLALHGNSDIRPADARNVYCKKTDKSLSYHQVSYMFGITSEELFGTTKNVCDASNNVLDYLTKKKIRYVSLCQDGVTDESLYLSYNNGKTVEISHLENESILSPAFSCADKYRKVYKVKPQQHLFMAVAWVTDHELIRFLKCPEVIHVDGTSSTNREKYILITVTVKDRFGKMCTVLRTFIPNEKQWVFHWLFIKVFPILFPCHLLDRIYLVISDGDSSECNQIESACRTVLRNTYRVRYGWHVVNRGWKKHCSNTLYTCMDGPERKEYKKIMILIQSWMYSWMKPGFCLDEAEYNISKVLLQAYVKSVTDFIGSVNVMKILHFIGRYVVVHEEKYLF